MSQLLNGNTAPSPEDMIGQGVVISSSAMVSTSAVIEGDVFIGPGTIVNPLCEIRAKHGPICIGEDNIFEEHTKVFSVSTENTEYEQTCGMVIGTLNLFEVGSVIEALEVGNCNVIEIKAHLKRLCTVTNGWVIGTMTEVEQNKKLENHSVIFRNGKNSFTRVQPRSHTLHFSMFRKYLDSLREPDSKTNHANWHTLQSSNNVHGVSIAN